MARTDKPGTPRLDDEHFAALARDLSAKMKAYVPGWTARQPHDPGVTLLELLAFLVSELIARQDHVSEEGYLYSHSAEGMHVAPPDVSTSCASLRRNRYFAGKLLTVDDLQTEQDYFRTKLRLHNLWCHGAGIVSGLNVQVQQASDGGQPSIVVEPGFAIDPYGEDIIVCDPLTAIAPAGGAPCFVSLLRVDIPVTLVPAIGTEGGTEASEIEERAIVDLSSTVPPGGIALARLQEEQSVLCLDPGFHPPRSR